MLGINISELNYRRLQNFKANKRGYSAFKIFIFLFLFTLFAEFLSNDKPLLIKYNNSFYFPIFHNYTEKTFDGDFETYTDYKDPYTWASIIGEVVELSSVDAETHIDKMSQKYLGIPKFPWKNPTEPRKMIKIIPIIAKHS